MWWGILSSIEWSEKNIKMFKIEKMAAVFLKILQMDFLEKATFKFFYFFFGGFSIIWTTYSPSLASGKQFLPIEKKKFEKKSKLFIFSKTTEERSKYSGVMVISGKKCCNKLYLYEFNLHAGNDLFLFLNSWSIYQIFFVPGIVSMRELSKGTRINSTVNLRIENSFIHYSLELSDLSLACAISSLAKTMRSHCWPFPRMWCTLIE